MHLYLFLAFLPTLISAHGYLSSPPPRGIQKAGYQIDDLKSPNTRGLCRGEPVGKITKVKPGQSLKLGLTITAPHIGPCRVTMLDADLKNEVPVAEKYNCAAPGGPGFWVIQLPKGVSGHKVLRWYWEGRHISTPGEPYEQCIDVNFGGASDVPYDGAPEKDTPGPDANPSRPPPTYNGGGAPSSGPGPVPKPPTYDDGDAPSRNGEGEKKPKRHHRHHSSSPSSSPSSPSYSSGGSCAAGAYECTSDGGFQQCANGSWVKMGCPASTKCRQAGTTIACEWAK